MNITLTAEQKEQNKQEARAKIIDYILEKIMEEKLNVRQSQNA